MADNTTDGGGRTFYDALETWFGPQVATAEIAKRGFSAVSGHDTSQKPALAAAAAPLRGQHRLEHGEILSILGDNFGKSVNGHGAGQESDVAVTGHRSSGQKTPSSDLMG